MSSLPSPGRLPANRESRLKDVDEYQVLNGLIQQLPLLEGKTRRYVERSSDIYQRVCRFMFHGEEHTANANRYAHCLREAARQGVKSGKLVGELSSGGINKFFMTRPSQGREREVETKCLRLNKAIRQYRSDTITLKLKRGADGVYEVLSLK